ncbi:MAG: hypothetical protein A2X67_11405 [Ignavibacteria bacterium GWA2_55_11]|nr:MAG: hypothetical protein A2X67_11405 [Ignavibacteria bacterium GWA2_55_11]OGU45688.1 MAG: hypothetical protein A2X68_04835 [Ignavibacteria bacterium GWC2_56_12]
MNSGQAMLIIGAFALLSTLTLAVNATIVTTANMGLEMEANLNALSYAQSMMDEIMTKDFDENTTNGRRVFTNSGMTAPSSFGADPGELISGVDSSRTSAFLSKSRFDDVDDYHGYQRWVWNDRLGWFEVRDTIRYTNEDNLTVQTSQSWHKKITINVQNYSMIKDQNGTIIAYRIHDVAVYRKYY